MFTLNCYYHFHETNTGQRGEGVESVSQFGDGFLFLMKWKWILCVLNHAVEHIMWCCHRRRADFFFFLSIHSSFSFVLRAKTEKCIATQTALFNGKKGWKSYKNNTVNTCLGLLFFSIFLLKRPRKKISAWEYDNNYNQKYPFSLSVAVFRRFDPTMFYSSLKMFSLKSDQFQFEFQVYSENSLESSWAKLFDHLANDRLSLRL